MMWTGVRNACKSLSTSNCYRYQILRPEHIITANNGKVCYAAKQRPWQRSCRRFRPTCGHVHWLLSLQRLRRAKATFCANFDMPNEIKPNYQPKNLNWEGGSHDRGCDCVRQCSSIWCDDNIQTKAPSQIRMIRCRRN